MSLLCLIGFIRILGGEIPRDEMTAEFLIIWALFSIADALWIGGRK